MTESRDDARWSSPGSILILTKTKKSSLQMRAPVVLILAALSLAFISACSRPRPASDIAPSISEIRRYAKSFQGLEENEVRGKLAGGELREETWGKGAIGGKELLAKFPEHEVRVLFLKDKVITTSIQILSK